MSYTQIQDQNKNRVLLYFIISFYNAYIFRELFMLFKDLHRCVS